MIRLIYGPFDGMDISTGEVGTPTWWIVSMIRAPLIERTGPQVVRDDVEPYREIAWYRRTFRTAPALGGNQLVVLYRFSRTERHVR